MDLIIGLNVITFMDVVALRVVSKVEQHGLMFSLLHLFLYFWMIVRVREVGTKGSTQGKANYQIE